MENKKSNFQDFSSVAVLEKENVIVDASLFREGFSLRPDKNNNEDKRFAQVFSNNQPQQVIPPVPSISEKDLLEARTKGYEDGYSKGYAAAKHERDELDKSILTSLNKLADGMKNLAFEFEKEMDKNSSDIAEMVVKLSKKIAGDALKNNPYAEIEKVVKRALGLLFNEPKVLVFVNNKFVENVKERISKIVMEVTFIGEVEVLGSADVPAGSCRVQWQGGGVKSNKYELYNDIMELYEKSFK